MIGVVKAAEHIAPGVTGSAFAAAAVAPFDGIHWQAVAIGITVAALAGLGAALNKWADDRSYDRGKWIRDFVVGGLAGVGAFWIISVTGIQDVYAQLSAMVFAGWAGPAFVNWGARAWERLK